jgi:APA family basic amino acid/polyamine antiporter
MNVLHPPQMNFGSLFLRKEHHEAAEGSGALHRSLTAVDLTLLGIGAIIGAGLFSSIKEMIVGRFDVEGHVVMHGAGPAVILSYVLTAVACGLAALCYAEVAAMVPVAGSAYSYSYAAFGELVAWIIGWDLIIEYAIGNIYVAQSWGDYFQTFLRGLSGTELPVWLTRDVQSGTVLAALPENAGRFPHLFGHVVSMNLPALAITMLLTCLLCVGIKESARANAAMVVLKLVLVAIFIALGVRAIVTHGGTHWTPFAPNGFKGVWQGAALGFFSYIGFDAVSTAGEECKNPQRDLPRGLIWSLVICTVLYMATAAVLTGVVPMGDLTTNDPLARAMELMGYRNIATVFGFGAVVAMTAVLLVFQLGQTRIFMVMARDGLLPPVFARVHPRFRTPVVSTVVTGLIVALGCSILTPDQAIGLTNIGTLFAFILVSLGVIVLRVRHPDMPRPFRVPLYPLTPILSALACLALVLGLEASNWIRLVVWLAVGLVVYFGYGYSHSVLRRSRAAAR